MIKKYAVFILFLFLFVPLVHATAGDVFFYDYANETPITNRWTSGALSGYENSVNITIAGGNVRSSNITTSRSTGAWLLNWRFYDDNVGFSDGSYFGFGFRTTDGAPTTGDMMIESGLCNQQQTNWAAMVDGNCPADSVVARAVGWRNYSILYNFTLGTALFYVDGVNFQNRTALASFSRMGAVTGAGEVSGKRITNITLCDTYCGAIVIPTTPVASFVAPTPASGSVNNTNVVINASCGTNLTTLWFDTSATPTTKVINNLSLGNYTTQASSTQTYYYIAACYNSTTGMSANSSVRNWTYDAVFPTITVNPTNEFNPQNYSRRSPYDKLVHLNFTIVDDHDVYGFSVNITRGGVVFFNYSNETLSGRTQYNYTATVNSASWVAGTYNVTVMASDTHTARNINDYEVTKKKSSIKFKTENGNNIKIETRENSDIEETRMNDRYKFLVTFDDGLTKSRVFDVKTDKCPLQYLENSDYNGHFVSSCGVIDGNWIDFEGAGTTPFVEKMDDYHYKVTFSSLPPSIMFESIGGLNIYQANFTFYHGNYSYNNPFALATDPTTLFSNFTHDTTTIANISSTFLYNGTLQTVTASNTSSYFYFTSTVTAPNATMLQLFNWSVTITQRDGNSSTFNITDNQNISLVTVSVCGATPIINFTSYDENTPANKLSIIPQVLFTYYTANSSLTKVLNTTMANNSVFSLCITPSYASVTGDLYIQYLADISQYTHRYYVFNGTYTNTTTTYNIYNWNNTGASLLKIITRYNSDYAFYPNVLTHLERRYIGENVWRIVQMDESGDYGLISFHIRELDTDYRLTYYDTDYHVLKRTDSLKFSCTSFLCELTQTLTPFSGSTTGTTFVTGFSFNNQTNVLSLTWNDPALATNTVTTRVTRIIDNLNICSVTQSGSSGVATCNTSNYTGSFQATVTQNGNLIQQFIYTINRASIGTLAGVREGSFWGAGIVLSVMMTGIFSPVAAMTMGVVGLIFVYMFGIMPWITIPLLTMVIVVYAVISWKVKS